jgi:hypothetical protein
MVLFGCLPCRLLHNSENQIPIVIFVWASLALFCFIASKYLSVCFPSYYVFNCTFVVEVCLALHSSRFSFWSVLSTRLERQKDENQIITLT